MERKKFKERVLGLFNKYKNKPIGSVEEFNNEIYLKYGFIPSSELSRSIQEYQIKKYGKVLTKYETGTKQYIKRFHSISKKCRDNHNELNKRNYQSEKLIERIEKEKSIALKRKNRAEKEKRKNGKRND